MSSSFIKSNYNILSTCIQKMQEEARNNPKGFLDTVRGTAAIVYFGAVIKSAYNISNGTFYSPSFALVAVMTCMYRQIKKDYMQPETQAIKHAKKIFPKLVSGKTDVEIMEVVKKAFGRDNWEQNIQMSMERLA